MCSGSRPAAVPLRCVAKLLAAPLSPVGRVLNDRGLGRLKNLQPAESVRRYQLLRYGNMIHVDSKQLARFERFVSRITCDRRLGCSRSAWYKKVQVEIVDPRLLAYIEVLPDEKQATSVGFPLKAVAWFDGQGSTARRCSLMTAAPATSGPGEKPTGLGLTPKRTSS